MYLVFLAGIIVSIALVFRRPSNKGHQSTQPELAKEIAHDIKNPLSALLSNLILLQEQQDPLTSRQRDTIKKIQTCAEHVHTLLETFLDISEFGVFKRKTFPRRIFLYEITREVISLLEPLAKEKLIKLYNNIAQDCHVYTDHSQCKQILFNVIHNAIKYCNQNDSVSINSLESKNSVLVTVRDSGPGFSDAHDTTGHGLGLNIIQNLIKNAGGTLEIESSQNGTSIMFTLPSQGSTLTESENDHDNTPLYGKKLLLVQKAHSDTQSTLSKLGAIVNKADAVIDALHELSAKRFDMVLIDDDLDLSTGYALAKVIKDDLKAKDTEVVILSKAQFDTHEASEFGVDGYVTKSQIKKGQASWRTYPCK